MDIRSRSAYLVMTPMLVSPAFGQRPNNPPGAGTPQPMGNMPGHDMSGADMQRMMAQCVQTRQKATRGAR